MGNLFKDFRYAIRSLTRHPTFTIVALFTLALGIGATTTIFSVVNAVLLRPLPYPDPDRLVAIWGNFEKLKIERLPAKAGEYEDYAKQTEIFDSVGAFTTDNLNFLGTTTAERIRGTRAAPDLLKILGAGPIIGRLFTSQDQDHVVVLSSALWQKSFAGDVDVINRTISLDGSSFKVIGVISSEFQLPQSSREQNPTDVWLPLTYSPEQITLRRGPYYLNVVGRLRFGVSLDQARSHMQRVAQGFERDLRGYRGPNGEDGGWRISVNPLMEEITGDSRRSLPVLLLAVFLLLGASCANVANLTLMRAEKRRKELAIRAALGASRWRITRQMLAEGIVLTIVATGVGLMLANWGIRILSSFADAFPRSSGLSIDSRVLVFIFLVAILTGLGLGVLPARQAKALHPLRLYGSSQAPRLKLANGVLVVSEVALATILLIVSGLLVKSLVQLQRSNPGVATTHLTVAEIDLTGPRYREQTNVANFFNEFTRSVESLPGVDAASFATGQPLSGESRNDPFAIEGRPLDPNNLTTAGWQLVGPNYLKTLGIPLLAGRDINAEDAAPGAAGAAIINEAMAQRYWPGQNPIGRRFTLGLPRPENPWLTIVGIASNIPHRTIGSQSEPDCYLSRVVSPETHRFIFVRSSLESSVLAASLRNELAQHDREQPLAGIKTMNSIIQETTLSRRFNTWILGLFAITALILATSGIYSVVSYSTSTRAQEIGIRIALGARSFSIVSLVVREGMTPVVVGALIGIGGASVFSRLISSLLFGTSAVDPVTYGLISGGLILVAAFACYVPVRRALRVDPLISLRSE